MGGKTLSRGTAAGAVFLLLSTSAYVRAPAAGEGRPPPPIAIVSPRPGAWESGAVQVRAKVSGPTVAVTFEVSLDQGQSWAPIGVDSDATDGWTATWRTLKYSGPARIRASKEGLTPAQDVVNVHIDNVRPQGRVRAQRRFVSPNRDGRHDAVRIRVKSNEPFRARIELHHDDRLYKRWSLQSSKRRTRSVVWRGETFRKRLVDGRYRIVAQIRDRAGLRTRVSDHLVVDRTPPRIGRWRVSPKPSSDPGRIRIRYRASDRWDRLSVRAYISGGAGVLSSRDKDVRSGRHSVRLRARYRNGDKLFPGGYDIGLTVTDAAGNRAARSRDWRVHRSMRGRVYTRLDDVGNRVALTFDDCYDGSAWSSILTTLRRAHVKASFFCNGRYVKQFAHLARRTVREGHTVGSHSWDHAVLAFRSYDEVKWRLLADRRAWIKYGGATSAPYFRPPYGSYDRNTVIVAGATSHPRVIMWDVDSGDTAGASGSTLVCNVVCDSRRGSIVLMHAKEVTADALPSILNGLRDRGLQPVTLPQMFRAAGYR